MVFSIYSKTRFGSVFLLLLCAVLAFGQSKTSEVNTQVEELDSEKLYRPNWAIKFMPSELALNYIPSLQFGLEKKTFQHQALGLDVAQLLNYQVDVADFRGYKIGTEYRFYRFWKSVRKQNTFIGLRGEWKQSFLSGETEFSRQDGAYRQILPFRSIVNTKNIFFIYGWNKRVKKCWATEIKLGLGARYVHLMYNEVPSDARFETNRNDTFITTLRRSGRYKFINGLVSFKLIYILKN